MTPSEEKGHGPDRRAAIMAAATELFLAHGFAGTSMAALARTVGIQKPSLYHHFPSKEALFIACVTEGYEATVRRLSALRADPALGDADRIRATMAELYRINLDTSIGRMAPLISEVAQDIPAVAETFHGGFITRQYDIVRGMVEDGIARGSFDAVDPLGIQHLIFGPIITLSLSREMTARFPDRDVLYPVDRIRASHIDLILRLLQGARAG
jgi:AcrR family transcriptional regulator